MKKTPKAIHEWSRREAVSSLILLALIFVCWLALAGRELDASQVTLVYKDF